MPAARSGSHTYLRQVSPTEIKLRLRCLPISPAPMTAPRMLRLTILIAPRLSPHSMPDAKTSGFQENDVRSPQQRKQLTKCSTVLDPLHLCLPDTPGGCTKRLRQLKILRKCLHSHVYRLIRGIRRRPTEFSQLLATHPALWNIADPAVRGIPGLYHSIR